MLFSQKTENTNPFCLHKRRIGVGKPVISIEKQPAEEELFHWSAFSEKKPLRKNYP